MAWLSRFDDFSVINTGPGVSGKMKVLPSKNASLGPGISISHSQTSSFSSATHQPRSDSSFPAHAKSGYCKISDITNNLHTVAVIGVVISKEMPKSVISRKGSSSEKHLLALTVCDAPQCFVNVTCWGSSEFVHFLSSEINVGDVVDIKGARVQAKSNNSSDEKFKPWTPCACHLSLSDSQGSLAPYTGMDACEYLSLLHVPTRANNDFYTLEDIEANGMGLQGEHLNILVAVKKIWPVREITTKSGKKTTKVDVVVCDETCPSFHLTLQDHLPQCHPDCDLWSLSHDQQLSHKGGTVLFMWWKHGHPLRQSFLQLKLKSHSMNFVRPWLPVLVQKQLLQWIQDHVEALVVKAGKGLNALRAMAANDVDQRVLYRLFQQLYCQYQRASLKDTPEAHSLRQFALHHSSVLSTEHDVVDNKDPDVEAITNVLTVRSAKALQQGVSSSGQPGYAVLFAFLSQFDIDADTDSMLKEVCCRCRRRVYESSGYRCTNTSCTGGNTSHDELPDVEYSIRVSLTDQTGSLECCHLLPGAAEQVLGYQARDFKILMAAEKTSIKWNYLLERVRAVIKIKRADDRSGARCFIHVLALEKADPQQLLDQGLTSS